MHDFKRQISKDLQPAWSAKQIPDQPRLIT